MSEAQRTGRIASEALALTEQARLQFREDTLKQAVELAKLGRAEESYRKLLMVVALDGVQHVLQGHIDSATIEKSAENANRPSAN